MAEVFLKNYDKLKGGGGLEYSHYSFGVIFLIFTFMEKKFETFNIKNSKRISRAGYKKWPNKIRRPTHNYKKSSLYFRIGCVYFCFCFCFREI